MQRAALAILCCLLLTGCNDIRRMRRNRNVDGLVALLADKDPHVRIKAADALGDVGDSRAIRPLIKALGDEDPYVREHAARNLGCDYHSSLGCDTGETARPLLKLLDDPDEFVRVEAARSLGERPLPAARAPLEKLLGGDRSWEVRAAAAIALGRISSAQSVPPLQSALEDDEEGVARAAQEALGRIASALRAGSEDGRLPGFDVDVRVGGPHPDGGPDAAHDGEGPDGGERE